MAIIKCKMCGGDIALNEEKTFGTCEYCGSTMTLPKVSDDQRAARFNRGNHFRRQGEFDKALAVYESIVREDDTDAEAHWCCALCRFGIEYVEDPNTYEYLPTCHRASFDSFTDDVDYLAALENSDGITKRQYQKDAAKISEVQKGILATSQNEEPYDVFICYKETDDNTKERTRDSLDAQEIYYQLTQAGYRVFFSRITLEDKAGAEYEPYIFAALNSAKVMVAVGSKSEYFNAVWVKNEWSRFLAMMRKDRSKLLIPCYKDMDPYDMPEQLGVLQSYDMAKIGFMQDLIRGIKKILKKDEPTQAVKEKVVVNSSSGNVAPLLKRAFMFLEDGDWSNADEYCEKVLDIDPENSKAYIGKLMAELCVNNRNALKNQEHPFNEKNNFKKAIRFGDEKLKDELNGYITHIIERNKNEIYDRAVSAMDSAKTESEYKDAANIFKDIPGWKDADKLAEECLEKAETARKDAIYNNAVDAMKKAKTAGEYKKTAEIFESISGWKDADELRQQCIEEKLRYLEANKKRMSDIRKQIAPVQNFVAAAWWHTVGLKADGKVEAVGKNSSGQCNVSDWTDIISVANGNDFTIGLRADGTVVATNYIDDDESYSGQCDVSEWKDIIAIAAGEWHAVGLKSDGTVVATKFIGDKEDYEGQCDVSDWTDIVAIAAGNYHTVGLKSDGTVVAVGTNVFGQCDVSWWQDIVAIAAGKRHSVGLKSDGSVVATRFIAGESFKHNGQCNVSSWTNIIAIAAGDYHTVGLKYDGRVVATSFIEAEHVFRYQGMTLKTKDKSRGQCNVSNWKLFRTRVDAESERTALRTELSNLNGLFSGKRRKEIEARLAQIDNELKKL